MSFRHILMALLVAAIWGFNFVVLKIGLKEMHPYLYGAERFLVVALPILFIKKPPLPWWVIGGIGLTTGLLKFTLMSMGIHAGMAAGLASLVLQSQSFFTLIFSVLLFKAKISTNQLVGMFIAVVGMFLIGSQQNLDSSVLGFIFILLGAMSWGVSNIIYRYVGNVDIFALTVWSSAVVPIPLFLMSVYDTGVEAVQDSILTMSMTGWICLLYTACLSSWVGSSLWGHLMRSYEPHLVAPFSLLVPVFGMTFSSIFLGEVLSIESSIASALIFTGLIVNQWRTSRPKVVVPQVVTQNQDIAEDRKAA